MKKTSFLPLVGVFCFSAFAVVFGVPAVSFAAVGDNCQMSLTTNVPESQDWNGVYIIRGEDGSAWQRGIISHPADVFQVRQGKTANISATVSPFTETAFFVYASSQAIGGGLSKPDDGVCFEGPRGDNAGRVIFPIHSSLIWNALQNDLVIDVFYRLDRDWNQIYGEKTLHNFFIGTYMFPRIARLVQEILPSPSPTRTPVQTASPNPSASLAPVGTSSIAPAPPSVNPPAVPQPPSGPPVLSLVPKTSAIMSWSSACEFVLDFWEKGDSSAECF